MYISAEITKNIKELSQKSNEESSKSYEEVFVGIFIKYLY
jgi:hypothetical protein